VGGIIVLSISQVVPEEQKQSKLDQLLEKAQTDLKEIQNDKNVVLYPPKDDELFIFYVYKDEFYYNSDGKLVPKIWNFIPKKELKETYETMGLFNESQNTVVIVPIFTANAYKVPGFYNYYDGSCDEKCLTVSIEDRTSGFTSSNSGLEILKFLQYEMITDVDVDKNPNILKKYDKVIVLHNEYVTKIEFDAITNHPNVVYLYPNALYAEVESNYENDTITLKRGHNYPEKEIINGFDWEFENTDPFEYDFGCYDWEFYEITNGVMLNCYPDDSHLMMSPDFWKILKDL